MRQQDYIRLFAGSTVTESDMDKETKYQLLNFVKEADIHEVMALLMDGEIQTVTEQAKPIVLERFKRSSNLKEKFDEFMLLEQIPKELNPQGFAGTGKAIGDFFKNIYKSGKELSQGDLRGKDFIVKGGEKSKGSFEKIASKMEFESIKSKISSPLGWIEKNLKIDGLTEKFKSALDALPDSMKSNPVALGTGLMLAVMSAITYAIVKKRKGEKEAKQEVQQGLEAKQAKMKADEKKAAKAVAKVYK